jgi:arsenate reductase (glutaredoxin)
MTDPFLITIFHNPECGTSRNVLAIIEGAGYRPNVIHYLSEGWTRPQLEALFSAAGVTAREALRETKSPAAALGLLDPEVSAEKLLEHMLIHPVLVNRPFVETPKGTRLCRPSETVLDLLDRWPPGPFLKEDGSTMIDAEGRRVS